MIMEKKKRLIALLFCLIISLVCCSCTVSNPNELTFGTAYDNEAFGRCGLYATVYYKTNARLKDKITFAAINPTKSSNGTKCNITYTWNDTSNRIITLTITVWLDTNFVSEVVHTGEFTFNVLSDGEIINTGTYSFDV